MIHFIYNTLLLIMLGLALFAIDTQQDRITELEYDLNVTQNKFSTQSSKIAQGLCLPILEPK